LNNLSGSSRERQTYFANFYTEIQTDEQKNLIFNYNLFIAEFLKLANLYNDELIRLYSEEISKLNGVVTSQDKKNQKAIEDKINLLNKSLNAIKEILKNLIVYYGTVTPSGITFTFFPDFKNVFMNQSRNLIGTINTFFNNRKIYAPLDSRDLEREFERLFEKYQPILT